MEEKEVELLREPSATFGGEGEALELNKKGCENEQTAASAAKSRKDSLL